MRLWDCAVVGAGPAGSATAALLARAGASVVLADRARFPRPKACGEGILPSGVRALEELGLSAEAKALGRSFRGVRYVTRSGRAAEGLFSDGEGLAAPREELDALLFAHAGASGASPLEGAELVGLAPAPRGFSLRVRVDGKETRLAARTLVAADGLSSPCLRALGVDRRAARRRRFGVAARFSGIEGAGGVVEVHLFERGELYLTPLPGGAVNVAALLDAPMPADALAVLMAERPGLAARSRAARLFAAPRGLGPLGGEAEACEGEGWVAVGDAAGAVDPLVGDGIGLALRGARLAADAVLARLGGRARPGEYAARRRELLRPKAVLSAAALSLTRAPVLAEAAAALLSRCPGLFAAVLSV